MSPAEQVIAKRLKAEGWTVMKQGWPDFLCVRGDEIKAVEVKLKGDRLSASQIENHRILRIAGISVEIAKVATKDATPAALYGWKPIRTSPWKQRWIKSKS